MSTKNIKVLSVNISERKGTIKNPVKEIFLDKNGIKDDAHSGNTHRQVSLLNIESIKEFEKIVKRNIKFGEFAENITTKGIKLNKAKIGDIFIIGNTKLEVTQIGKKCHGNSCAIFKEVGNCIMPKQGIFCKVIQGGTIKSEDKIIYFSYQIK